MALGSTTIDDTACNVYESKFHNGDSLLSLTLVDIASFTAGRSQGVTPEHLSKIWQISFDDAVKT